MTEKEIQNYIWERRGKLSEIFETPKFPEPLEYGPDLEYLTPARLLQNRLLSDLEATYKKFLNGFLIGSEVSLHQESDSTIRADLLGVPEGENGICIIELKKSRQTERQAFTELLAYANHFATIFPTMCKRDILFVLISPMEERIVREAFIHTWFFDRKPILAFTASAESIKSKEPIFSLYLPSFDLIEELSRATFAEKNFSVSKHVWETIPGHWNPSDSTAPEPDEFQKERLNHAASMAAQMMESYGIHGFAYASQLWPEFEKLLPLSNSIVLVGLNPFAIASSKLISKKQDIPEEEVTGVDLSWLLSDFIPGLEKFEEDNAETADRFHFLYNLWDDNLIRIGFDIIKRILQNTAQKYFQTDSDRLRWDHFQRTFLEDAGNTNLLVYPTGIIRELYWDTVTEDYARGLKDHPHLGDMFYFASETLSSQVMFRTFLNRMFYSKPEEYH